MGLVRVLKRQKLGQMTRTMKLRSSTPPADVAFCVTVKKKRKLLTAKPFQTGGKITINWLIFNLPIIQITQFSIRFN
jgi:hypothetical protein